MKSNKFIVIALCASVLLAFTYGVATVHYKIFPFEQLQTIKRIASPSPIPSHSPYYYHKKSFFEQHGGHDYDVVFIGDSITDGAEWQDLFPALKIANRGIDGDRTDGVLNRLESIYSTSSSSAFIMIGINDFSSGMSVEEVFDNYKAILNKLAAKKMKVYIQSTIFGGKKVEYLNKKIAALNEKLQLLAAQEDSFRYIDLNAGLAQNSLLKAMYTMDDIHLNGDGYAVWKEIIMPYIQQDTK